MREPAIVRSSASAAHDPRGAASQRHHPSASPDRPEGREAAEHLRSGL